MSKRPREGAGAAEAKPATLLQALLKARREADSRGQPPRQGQAPSPKAPVPSAPPKGRRDSNGPRRRRAEAAPDGAREEVRPAAGGEGEGRRPDHAGPSRPKPLSSEAFFGSKRSQVVEAAVQRLLCWGSGYHFLLPQSDGEQRRRRRELLQRQQHVWKTFPRQELAFKWADSETAGGAHGGPPGKLRFFSVESGANGRRSYIVSNLNTFWSKYSSMDPAVRHHYELIREGWPCHLYFDLEFPREANPGLDGDAMVASVLRATEAVLKERFSSNLPTGWSLRPEWVLELDSTSGKKFSRHLVLQLAGGGADGKRPIAFRSNAHAGEIARLAVEHLLQEGQEEGELAGPRDVPVMVSKGDGGTTTFVDLAVYSRNRVFRMIQSSKLGKQEVLAATQRYAGGLQLSERELFRRSLVCRVSDNAELLVAIEEADPTAKVCGTSQQRAKVSATAASGALCSTAGQSPSMAPSPFPRIDTFIERQCRQEGLQGTVRSWMMLPDAGVLLLNIRGNRWCGNIGRHHKSNGVFYIVDLHSGFWFQKCYDPDCRHYRSQAMPLPSNLIVPPPPGPQVEPSNRQCRAQELPEGGASVQRLQDGKRLAFEGKLSPVMQDQDAEDDQAALDALEQYELDLACIQALDAYERVENGDSPVVMQHQDQLLHT